MKREYKFLVLIILAIIALYPKYLSAQEYAWNLISTTRKLGLIKFFGSQTGLIFGQDIFYKSTNGGTAWQNPVRFLTFDLSKVNSINTCSFDTNCFWMPMGNRQILRTTNSGNVWTNLYLDIDYSSINSVSFINKTSGWIFVEKFDGSKLIKRTTNGGVDWYNIITNFPFSAQQLYMLSQSKGFILHKQNDSIAMTTNGGLNWSYRNFGIGVPGIKIIFTDSLKGIIIFKNSNLARTINGGVNWVLHPNGINNVNNINFINPGTGWICAGGGTVWKTLDSGKTWTLKVQLSPSNVFTVNDIYFKNANTGWLIRSDGIIMTSSNGGNSWTNLNNPPPYLTQDAYFTNISTGYIVTQKSPNSYIYKSTDKGCNWFLNHQASNRYYIKIIFSGLNKGYSVGDSGYVLRTVNGGLNWNSFKVGNINLNQIAFANENTGWICGGNGNIYKTTNSGNNWISQTSGIAKNLNNIFVISPDTVYIVGDSAYFLKTFNGGNNWGASKISNHHSIGSIFFINANTGFITASRYYTAYPIGYPVTVRDVLKTENAGLSWNTVIHEDFAGGAPLFNGIYFINNMTGWAFTNYVYGNDPNTIKVFITTNSGSNWQLQTIPKLDGYVAVRSVNTNTSWLIGRYGNVLCSENFNVGIENITVEIPDEYVLEQNYPNPFNSSTKIVYKLPSAGNVLLNVYDILGREVAVLVNSRQNAGNHSVNFEAGKFSSGIYFYRLNIYGKIIDTKRAVHIK